MNSPVPGPDPAAGSSKMVIPKRGDVVPASPFGRELLVPFGGQVTPAPDTWAYLQALRRRWLLALGLGLLAAAASGIAAWFLVAPLYTAFAQVQIAATEQRLLHRVDSLDVGTDYLTYRKTQIARIKSRPVLNAALAQEEVKKLDLLNTPNAEPILGLENEIKVDAPEGSEIVTVSMSSPDSAKAVTLVKAVTDAYLEDTARREAQQRVDHLAELDKAARQAHDTLQSKRDEWRKLADHLGTSDAQAVTEKQLSHQARLTEVEKQHTQVQFELLRARRLLADLTTKAKLAEQPVPEPLVSQALDTDVVGKYLAARLVQLQAILADYEHNAIRSDETGMVTAKKDLAATQKALTARRNELRAELTADAHQKMAKEMEVQRTQLLANADSLEEQEKGLQAEISNLMEQTVKLGALAIKFQMLNEEIQKEEKGAIRVTEEGQALRVELQAPPRVSLYQPATVQKKDVKRRLLGLTLGPLLALAGVCLCVSYWEIRAQRIQTVHEVSAGLGMRVMGAVPALPRPLSAAQLIGPPQGAGAQAINIVESIDAIRTLLLRDAGAEGPRVLMVTSAVAREGKTTLAAHLAGSLARAGRTTLLVDCDLRRPSLHQLFGMSPQPGFTEVVLGKTAPVEAIRATTVKGLWVLPAGQWNRDVLLALAQDGARKLFDQVKKNFDFIVVDSHPVLLATDSLLIGQQVDGVILSLLRGVSQAPVVSTTCQRLATMGIRVMGAVVNGMDPEDWYDAGYRYATQTIS